MKDREVYELDISGLFALLLIRWKQILGTGLLAGLLILAAMLWLFRSPQKDYLEHQQIRSAIAQRKLEEENLRLAQKQLDENLLCRMDPAAIVTKQLTVTAILEDQSLVHDRADPADLVLYAYYDQAMTQFQGEVLVPELLTKLQQEQLLLITLNTEQNVLVMSMTAEDAALADAVLTSAAQWYQQIQPMIADQTHAHRLELLPVTETVYSREERELLVSSAEAESRIQELKLNIALCNDTIENLLPASRGWASAQTVEALEAAVQSKWQKESSPSWLPLLAASLLLGLIAGVLRLLVPVIAAGRLLGENGVRHLTGWCCLGRTVKIPEPGDLLEAAGLRWLYGSAAGMEALQEMTELALSDRGLTRDAVILLAGAVPAENLRLAAQKLNQNGWHAETAVLPGERVRANRLCREADAVIFAADEQTVTEADVQLLREILDPLGKTPLGYVIV